MNLFPAFRATLFYVGFLFLVFWFSTTGVLFFYFLPYRIRSRYIIGWNRCTIAWATWTCGLKVKVIGKENLPNTPYVALAKHQSQWETYFLQAYLNPVSVILKKELLDMPFFGWGLRLSDPIPIDRSNPKKALKKVNTEGTERLSRGISVLIFPEGTRVDAGKVGRYARSGASIAMEANVPVIPIAHNAGEYWPSNGFIKYPGTITVVIGKPLSTEGLNSKQVTENVKNWIEDEVSKLDKFVSNQSTQAMTKPSR